MKKNRLLFINFCAMSLFAFGCSDPKGGEDDVSEFSIEVSNPDGLRDLSLVYQAGSSAPDTVSNLQTGTVKMEVPEFLDSILIQYSISSMGYVLVTKQVTLYSDLTQKENALVVQKGLMTTLKEIQKDTAVHSISLSTLYQALFQTLNDSGSLAVAIRDQDTTKNRTESLLDTTYKFFIADTAKFVLSLMVELKLVSNETVEKVPADWDIQLPTPEISDSLLFSITSESQLALLPGEYTAAQVDSMKIARLKDSVFTDTMVEVSPGLLVSRWEVTQKQYFDRMGYATPAVEDENKPITSVSVYDAILYCNAISQVEGLDPVYSWESVSFMGTRAKGMVNLVVKENANGYRLPTVSEWAIAYTSGILTGSSYYWGNDAAPAITKTYANVAFDGASVIENVGLRLPTPNGLFDMNGNVAERTIDSEDGTYYSYLGGSYLSESVVDFEPEVLDGARPDVWLGFRVFRYKL